MPVEIIADQITAAALGASLTNVATSITLATGDGAKFPTAGSGQYRIRIDDEIILVGDRSGDVLSPCTRGQSPTSAVAHSNSAVVILIPTAAGLYNVFPALFVGTTATLPTSPRAGAFAVVTDGNRGVRVATATGLTFWLAGYGYVNVQSFDLLRDGTTDETTKIADAATAAGNNKAVYIPEHTNPIVTDWIYPQIGQRWIGQGPTRSTWKLKDSATGTGGTKSILYNADGVTDLHVEGLTFDCNGANQGGTDGRGIILRGGPSKCRFHNLEFLNCVNDAPFFIDGTSTAWAVGTAYVVNNQVKDDGDQYIALGSSTGKQPNKFPALWRQIRHHNELDHIWVPPGSKQGLSLNNVSHTHINRLVVQGCSYVGSGGAINVSDAPYTKMVDVISEGNKCHGISVLAGANYAEIINPTCRRNMDQIGGDVRGITIVASVRSLVMGGDLSHNGENGILVGNGDDAPYFRLIGTRIRNNWNDRYRDTHSGNDGTQLGGHGVEMLSHDSMCEAAHIEGNRSGVWMNAERCSIVGCTIVLNYEHGILSTGADRQRAKGCNVMNNGLFGTNFDGISLGGGGTGPTNFIIEDCNIGEDATIGALGSQRAAVNDSSLAATTEIFNSRLMAGVYGATTPIIIGNTTGRYRNNRYFNSSTVEISPDPKYATYAERELRVMLPNLPIAGTWTLLTGVGYWVYLGRTRDTVTPKFVEFLVTTIGAGAQTAEVGLFSTPNAPSKAAQSLTKIVSTATVDALTSTGVKRNTTGFATQIAPYTHLWAGIRTAMATTQPTLRGLFDDMSEGNTLSLAAAGVLTGAGPWAGAIPAINLTAAGHPMLRAVMD